MKWFMMLFPFYILTCLANEDNNYWQVRYDERGLPLVDVIFLNEKHTLMLDTGSGTGLHLKLTDLEKSKINAKNRIKSKEIRHFIDITGKERKVSSIKVDELEISNIYFHDFEVVDLKPWGLAIGGELPSSEVMGLEMFNNKIIIMDFKKNRIEFLNHLPNDIESWSLYPINKTKSGLVINVMVGSERLDFIIDTAASHSIIFENKLPNENKLLGCDFLSPELSHDDCQVIEFYIKRKGNEVVKNPAIIVPSANNEQIDFDGLLGMNYLKNKVFIMDLSNNNLYGKK